MNPEPSVFLPATRHEARQRLSEFLAESAGNYAHFRNHVLPGHGNVSRLSPATRTRLLLETEICEAAREMFPPHQIEKFEQEVWWRLYWKGWLEMRPSVWRDYQTDLSGLEWSDRAREVAAGESGVAIMDHFAKELIETGYLHNHARMWWASFWIHVEKLPWQLGADFFLRHLLDGDPASNTLSWRWVAGLHTKGKSYLVRRSNLERYLDAVLLNSNSKGLNRLEKSAQPAELEYQEPLDSRSVPLFESKEPPNGRSVPLFENRVGIWIHDEDLLVENSPIAELEPSALLAPVPTSLWDTHRYSATKREFLTGTLGDGIRRASEHFNLASGISTTGDLAEALVQSAMDNHLSTLVTMQPFTGPLADQIPHVREALRQKNISLRLVRRPGDVAAMNFATAGFFGFWKKTAALREAVPV